MAFKRAYPDIRLDVRFDNRVSDLIGEDVDVALRIVSNPPESLVATLLDEVDWVLCAAPDYLAMHGVPKTLEALAEHAIVSAPAVGQPLRLSAQLGDERTLVTLDFDFFDDRRFPPGLSPGVIICSAPDEAGLRRLLRHADRTWLRDPSVPSLPLKGRKITLTPDLR